MKGLYWDGLEYKEGCFGYDFLSENLRIYLVVASWPNPIVFLRFGLKITPWLYLNPFLDTQIHFGCCASQQMLLSAYVVWLNFVRPWADLCTSSRFGCGRIARILGGS